MTESSSSGLVPADQVGAFLQACKEIPEDDTPRLIFADWLEERDDPRGPFIRLQCQLARLSDLDARSTSLRSQEEELRNAHGRQWLDPLKGLQGTLTFERGLLQLRFGQGYAKTLTPRVPPGAPGSALAWLEELRVWQTPPEGLLELMGPILGHVTSLNLATPAAESAVSYANWAPRAPRTDGRPEWVVCDQLRHLRRLSLSGRMLLGAGLEALTGSALDNLRELQLADTGISADGAECLASAPWLIGLTTLNLAHNQLQDRGLLHLLPRLQSSALRRLDLGSNLLTEQGLKKLAGSALLGRLHGLDLSGNQLSGEGMKALAGIKQPGRLTHLNLASNSLEDDDVVALAQSPLLAQVRTLNLSINRIGRRGAEALAQSPYLGQLSFLELSYNQLGSTPLRHWITSPYLGSLRILHLGNNRIDDEALEGLAGAPKRVPLATLILRRNSIGDHGLTQLLHSSVLPGLLHLDLDSNQLRQPGAIRLAETEALRHLRILHINNNEIGDGGALAVAGSPHLQGLERLYIDGNRIVGQGMKALQSRFGSRADV